VIANGNMWQAVMERMHPFQLAQDPDRAGLAVLVRVDRVRSGNDVIMQRGRVQTA
jgi:hypothetical protein